MQQRGRSGPGDDMRNRLIVALDVPTVEEARALVGRLGDAVRFYKVGMWLFFAPGADAFVDELVRSGKQVFFDYKMYDIPETVRRGVGAVAGRGARIVTVHGDPEIVAAAVEGAAGSACLVFAISVLTSQDDAALQAMGYARPVAELVALRAAAAGRAGADGLIASAADDLAGLRAAGGGSLLLATPGIRLAGREAQDQKRVATPDAAMARGADFIVVGRPITQAGDPGAVARDVLALMDHGQAKS